MKKFIDNENNKNKEKEKYVYIKLYNIISIISILPHATVMVSQGL